MLLYLISIFVFTNLAFTLYVWSSLKKEQKRSRILQAFIAGLVRSVSDYRSVTDKYSEEVPEHNSKLPIPYKKVLEAVDHELSISVSLLTNKAQEKWMEESRQLFVSDEKWRDGVCWLDDGFNFMNYDLWDAMIFHWHSGELISPQKKSYLREDVVVTEENVGELKGEIAMFRDLLAGKLPRNGFSMETLDNRLSMMFNHIKTEHLEKLKQEILKNL